MSEPGSTPKESKSKICPFWIYVLAGTVSQNSKQLFLKATPTKPTKMSNLVRLKSPKMDWTTREDLTTRFKGLRNIGSPSKNVSIFCYGLDPYSMWSLTTEKKDINKYWKRFKEHLKPQANKMLNWYYLHNLKQNGWPLDAWLTEARLVIQNCGYLDKMQGKIMQHFLVFGTDHEAVWKKCITKGNNFTFKKAGEIVAHWRSYPSTA